jgi:catechol 2,3-dioxygenase-like lactoylglutathione lyase family enzyme
MSESPVLRVARPTDDLTALIPFYRDGLGFDILSGFTDHAGFDVLMFGRPGAPYHFEFTHDRTHRVGRAPTRDHLVVLYPPDKAIWGAAVARMRGAGFEPVASYNPYWDHTGVTFEDPDGYRVVLQNGPWPG